MIYNLLSLLHKTQNIISLKAKIRNTGEIEYSEFDRVAFEDVEERLTRVHILIIRIFFSKMDIHENNHSFTIAPPR